MRIKALRGSALQFSIAFLCSKGLGNECGKETKHMAQLNHYLKEEQTHRTKHHKALSLSNSNGTHTHKQRSNSSENDSAFYLGQNVHPSISSHLPRFPSRDWGAAQVTHQIKRLSNSWVSRHLSLSSTLAKESSHKPRSAEMCEKED